MGIETVILTFNSIALIVLGLFVLLRNIKNPINISFFIMLLGTVTWISSNAYDYKYFSEILTRFTYVGAIIMVVGYFYFSWYFPYQIKKIKPLYNIIIIAVTTFFIIASFFGGLIIKEIIDQHTKILYGSAFPLYNIAFLIFWIIGLSVSILKLRKSDGLHRWQLNNIIFVLQLGFLAGITTNLILPWFFDIWNYGWVGPLFTIFLFGSATYILFKKNI